MCLDLKLKGWQDLKPKFHVVECKLSEKAKISSEFKRWVKWFLYEWKVVKTLR